MMMQNHRQDLDGAWGAAAAGMHRGPPPPPPGAMLAARGGGGGAAARWGNEFHGHEMRGSMMHQPHPAELEHLEAAWAAQQGGFGSEPMAYGPDGPPPPPPAAAFGPGMAPRPGMHGQVTTAGTIGGGVAGSSGRSTAFGVDSGFLGDGGVGDAATAASADVTAESLASAGGDEEKGEGEGEIGASARSLAGQMAADPDGRFRDSELLRFASRLGTGGLRVSGDKVLFFSSLTHSFRGVLRLLAG